MQSPTIKPVLEEDSEVDKGDINFGRDDSDRGDVISEVEKVDWENLDTKSLLEEI